MPITAIGSVGEISAPNSRQYMNGNCRPTIGKAIHIPYPTASVDISVPRIAKVPTCQR